MSRYFDDQEQTALTVKLWQDYGPQSGMDRQQFGLSMRPIFNCLDRYGFDKARIKADCAEYFKVPGSFVDLVWDAVSVAAQSGARKSVAVGVWATLVLGLILLLRLLPKDLTTKLTGREPPDWLYSPAMLIFVCIALLLGIYHWVRGMGARQG